MPDLQAESGLFASGAGRVAGVDEVGRGALAGPVAVGIAVVDAHCGPMPVGLADSKELTARKRQVLDPLVREWACDVAVGYASALEIDELGIMAALTLAGNRAVAQLRVPFDAYLIDGTRDWLAIPDVRGVARVKADRDCASVSAASIVAKVERDALMVQLHEEFPQYGWSGNKGYGSADHMAAISRDGATQFHRRSWSLPVGEIGAQGDLFASEDPR